MRRGIVIVVMVATGGAAVTGCTTTIAGHPGPNAAPTAPATSSAAGTPDGPRVSAAALQKMVTDQLTAAGVTPQRVDCPQDLLGRVGQTARCDVTVTAVNSFEPIISVTAVDGTQISYAMTPSVTAGQLQVAVADMVGRSTTTAPEAVSCESGLAGTVGATAYCAVTVGGVATRQAVAVTRVQGLSMEYRLVPESTAGAAPAVEPGQVLPKAVAEGALLAQLRQSGQNADSASCLGDLRIAVDATMACVAVTGGQPRDYVLAVASVANGSVTFKVTPAQ
ncbi:DUF4333 domain-containing protein [Mycolicibacterium sp. J2]|uniref:DUF4333 domain-containing protein n=1 Tax=Mycolicibacterium sp. J2 TaxID=2993511 RepID=UPI00224B859B|nr:DUF4333 domain-containing protein [Mycolicibacterium sp. J2]MCX2711111.1 DUF4333 domain-containing protein [Mycolicibacterium sp. J2]